MEENITTNELANALTSENVQLLQEILLIPSAIVETTGTNALKFLNALRFEVNEFDPLQFIQSLETIQRPELIPLTSKISWLNPFESFVSMLRESVESAQWKLILGSEPSEKVTSEIEFETAFKLCIEGDLIKPDLENICDVMLAVGRHDVVENIQKYSNVFYGMNKNEFQSKLMNELECDQKEDHDNWNSRLRDYTKQQNENVYIHFDDEETTPLDSVYTSLTVIEDELIKIKSTEDTSLNEIAFLRSMSGREKPLKVVDFISNILMLDVNKPKIICLIGNPGCGKTFLCKYLALQYGSNKYCSFQYVLSAQCRSENWHTMEKSREENDEKITSHFVHRFLANTLPLTAKWSQSLSRYLGKSDGESLLLILDGIDEFIKDVPFKSTLLYSLLQRSILTRSTVLLTSRPGAWNELREEHGQELKVDSNFQVLGFSPKNRDSYFKKRIITDAKLRDTKELFFRHDEINQLSLIPVNASLFTSLFNATKNILSQTLTHLYSALIVYIVRRQLSRMGLKKLTRVERVAQFHPSVLECIGCIGEEAYEGIFHRELSCREEDIAIRVDSSEYKTERLGLMQVQVKLLKLGHRVNVWTFAHLTLQEYMSAVYLSNKTWVMQCVMIRFIVSSEEVFSMYKMVVRFLCGLLSDSAACLIPIICRNLIPDTMPLIGFPMVHQLGFLSNIIEVSDWSHFTQVYLLICTLIIESNSRLMKFYFDCLSDLLPEHLYFCFDYSVSPNEWHCFLLSLGNICKIEIILIEISHVNPIQLSLLLHRLSSCSLSYLSIVFHGDDPSPIHSYTNLLFSTDIPINYKINISLYRCVLTESQPSSHLFPTTNNKLIGSIRLNQCELSREILTHLINQFSCVENLFYEPKSDDSDWSILHPMISNNKQIKGLYIYDPKSYLPVDADILSGLSSLEELTWYKKDPYTVLPHLQTNNSLSYLSLFSPKEPPLRENYEQLITIISNNSTSLRDIQLVNLHTVGLNSWTRFLTPIQSCCNLVSLRLSYSQFSSDDISYWDTAILYLKSLVELVLIVIPLQDTGLMTLCKSMNRHPAIRSLRIDKCDLTSDSCEPIMMLIHTLPYLRLLKLYEPELSLPDANSLQLLQQTAELFSVQVELRQDS